MNKLFLIGALLVAIVGAIVATLSGGEAFIAIFGFVILGMGVILLISGFLSPGVAGSKTGQGLGIFMIIGAIVAVIGMFTFEFLFGMPLLAGGALIFIVCIAWPCVCRQGTTGLRSQIIGVASSHESISVAELSRITGATEQVARNILYDAIGKRQLSGRMEGDTFKRTGPSAGIAPDAKVLVICPYCGAKTEQGLAKCQNCQASL